MLMKTIDQTYKIKAPIGLVWRALTDASVIDKWDAGPADFDAIENGKFSLWGGDIHGTNTKLVKDQLLEQDWYSNNTPNNCYKISFSLKQDGDETTIHLVHPDVPDDEVQDFEEGWKDYYFDPIKRLLEK